MKQNEVKIVLNWLLEARVFNGGGPGRIEVARLKDGSLVRFGSFQALPPGTVAASYAFITPSESEPVARKRARALLRELDRRAALA